MNLERLTVLHINKFHHVIGGSDVIYFRTAELLEKHGHKSVFFSMKHPLNLPCITSEYFMPFIDLETNCNIGNYLLAACRNFYSFKARKLVSGLLDKYKADMVHIHDLHRQISPSILYEFRKRNIPVVMTLHQYKMICPSYLMFAHDNPCEACDKGKYYSAIKLRCVKGALLRSALVSAEMYLHHKILDVYRNVDVFIAPSLFLKYKHEEMGFKKKSVHLPYPLDIRNFEALDNDVMPLNYDNGLTFTFFGRLVPEKGLFTLIDALKILAEKHQEKNLKVRIIGEGPIKNQLLKKVEDYGLKNVEFVDFLAEEKLYHELKKVHAVIIPSEWYENYPVSVMEAFALKKPVIGARIGGIPEMVKDGETGLTFESGNPADLSDKINYLINDPDAIAAMGQKARLFIEQEVNYDRHYQKLMEIYRLAISLRSRQSRI